MEKKNIGIIGNGFVGSAIAAGFALHANVKVFDSDNKRSINSLYETVNGSNFIFISVPTPMKHANGAEIDLRILDSVINDIVNVEKDSEFSYDSVYFIIKSTVIPGTVERYEKQYPFMNFVFNPEFLTERSANLDFINSARIVLGGNASDVEIVSNLYRDRFKHTKIIKTDFKSAEFIKYMCNCFFATKISYMNEMFSAAKKLGCNWDDVMNGFMSDGRIGNSHTDVPGHDGDFGFGGKCFPKDINAFISFFNDINESPIMLTATWEKNKEVRKDIDWATIEGAVSSEEKE